VNDPTQRRAWDGDYFNAGLLAFHPNARDYRGLLDAVANNTLTRPPPGSVSSNGGKSAAGLRGYDGSVFMNSNGNRNGLMHTWFTDTSKGAPGPFVACPCGQRGLLVRISRSSPLNPITYDRPLRDFSGRWDGRGRPWRRQVPVGAGPPQRILLRPHHVSLTWAQYVGSGAGESSRAGKGGRLLEASWHAEPKPFGLHRAIQSTLRTMRTRCSAFLSSGPLRHSLCGFCGAQSQRTTHFATFLPIPASSPPTTCVYILRRRRTARRRRLIGS